MKIEDIPEKFRGHIFKNFHYRKKRKYIRETDPYLFTYDFFHPLMNLYIESKSEVFFTAKLCKYLDEQGLVIPDAEWLELGNIVADLEEGSNMVWGEISKNFSFDEGKELLKFLLLSSRLRATAFIQRVETRIASQIKTCQFPGCNERFWASRTDSNYCDKCRKKAHVYNWRNKNRKIPLVTRCHECNKVFSAKTKRARFCSTACRVRANRKKVTSSQQSPP